jgi:hypothetical protein
MSWNLDSHSWTFFRPNPPAPTVQAYVPTSPAAQTPASNNYTYDYDYYEDIYRGGPSKSLLRVPFETAYSIPTSELR